MIQKRIHALDSMHTVSGRPAIKDLQPGRGCFTGKRDSGLEIELPLLWGRPPGRPEPVPYPCREAEQGSAL